jgi:nitrous oxide reductase
MDERQTSKIRRRDLLIAAAATGVATAMGAKAVSSAATAGPRNKRKAQYQPNSPEVQTYYRVNRYPAKS